MDTQLLSPKQKEIYEEFKKTFDEELSVLKKRKDLIRTWRSLRIEEGIKKTHKALRNKK